MIITSQKGQKYDPGWQIANIALKCHPLKKIGRGYIAWINLKTKFIWKKQCFNTTSNFQADVLINLKLIISESNSTKNVVTRQAEIKIFRMKARSQIFDEEEVSDMRTSTSHLCVHLRKVLYWPWRGLRKFQRGRMQFSCRDVLAWKALAKRSALSGRP